MTDEEDTHVPDDLPFLLRSARPEAQDYVANLDQDKYTKMYKRLHFNIETSCTTRV